MKAVVVGIGGMGKGVARLVARQEGVQEVIAVDVVPAQLQALQNVPGIRTTTDYRQALADPAVRLVFVTASNDAHKPLAMAAFDAGKAVMCEKPIALTLSDASEMVQAAERKKLFFQIGFEARYSLLYTKIKQWIDAGLLGQIVNTQNTYICSEFHGKGSWRNNTATGGSMFGEKLCHYVDLPRWWIGSQVKDVFSVCAPNVVPYYEVRDNYQTTYRFANGAVSHLTFMMYIAQTFAGDPLQNVVSQQNGDGHELRYLVVGTRGAAQTDVFNRTIKRWEFGDSAKSMTSRLVETLTWDPQEDDRYVHNGTDQNTDIVRRVRAGLPPATPARDALETMRLVFAAEKSAECGSVVRLDQLD